MESTRSLVPKMRAASRTSSALTAQVSATASGVHGATPCQRVEADRVRGDVVHVDPAVHDELADQPVHSATLVPGLIARCTSASAGHLCLARIDAHHEGAIRAREPVEHPRPQHRLRLGHVVAVEEERVAVVDVLVGARLTVRTETLFHRRGRGRGAQAGVAVHMRRADAGFADDRERVVLLEEELPTRIEGMAERPLLLKQCAAALDDPRHRGVPVGLHKLAVDADQRAGEPICAAHALPRPEQPLGAEAPLVDRSPAALERRPCDRP